MLASFVNPTTPEPDRSTAQEGLSRALPVRGAEEADQLVLAFGRYIELHGRALADPRSGCSIARLVRNGGEIVILTFWSRRAAQAFGAFWRRYQPIYAAPRSPPRTPRRRLEHDEIRRNRLIS